MINLVVVEFPHLGAAVVPGLVELVELVAGLVVFVVVAGFVCYKLTTFVPL